MIIERTATFPLIVTAARDDFRSKLYLLHNGTVETARYRINDRGMASNGTWRDAPLPDARLIGFLSAHVESWGPKVVRVEFDAQAMLKAFEDWVATTLPGTYPGALPRPAHEG